MFLTGWITGIPLAIIYWYFVLYLPKKRHLRRRIDTKREQIAEHLNKKIEQKRKDLNLKRENIKTKQYDDTKH